MSYFLCVVWMQSALQDICPVNMSKFFAVNLAKEAKPQSQVFSGPWTLYNSLPGFHFVFKNGFYLALNCSQKK